MIFNVDDIVRDLTDSKLGIGKILNIYTNRHDDPNGITTYTVDFSFMDEEDDENEEMIADRFAHELEKSKVTGFGEQKKFTVKRHFTLSMLMVDYYHIEAENAEEAEQKVMEGVSNGLEADSSNAEDSYERNVEDDTYEVVENL